MKQTATCERNPITTAHSSHQTPRAPITIRRRAINLLNFQMPRIAAMTSDGAARIRHGGGHHGVTGDAVLPSSTEHDEIEPNVFSTTCEWAAGRPDVIRMDLPNTAAIVNATTNNSVGPHTVESSRSLNPPGMSLPSSVLYHNAVTPMIDQNSNSNLAPFPTAGLGSDSNSNWQISRHGMEQQNSNLNNPTDAGRIPRPEVNGLLRTMDPRSFSWFPQVSQVFSNDDDDQNGNALRQMQSTRRMTRSMRRRVVSNDQRQDIEFSTVLTSRPRRSPILTRNRSSLPSHISIPNPTVSSAVARNSASTIIGSSSPNMITGSHSPLTSSMEAASVTRNVRANAVASSLSSKSLERPVTHCTRKRSSAQANISTQNESRKKAASTRNPEASQPMSTRSQSSTLSSKKQKKIVDNKKTPATKKESQTNDESKRCCICLDEPTKPEISKLDSCKHIYCFLCIEKWAERENTCPLCKTRFHKIERVHKVSKPRGRRGATAKGSPVPLKNMKKVKNRDQRSDYGRNVQWQGLLERMEAGGLHHHFAQFIFSGLNAFGTPNLMSFEANVPNVPPFSSAINIQRMPSRQHSTPQRTSASNNRSTFAEYATRSRQNNVARVRGHHHTIDDDVTRSLTALRSTLLSHRPDPISSPSDTTGARASFADFQPAFTHGASEAFGVGDGDVGPRFNRESSDPFAGVDLDASMESNDESEEEGNPGRFYQRIRNLRRERSAVLERFHFNDSNAESRSFHRASAAVDSLGDISSSVFDDPFDRVLSVPRSFAANGHQADAGETAATPLEIIDSDDEDDGVVEVLVVNEA